MHCDKWLCHKCNSGIDASVGFSDGLLGAVIGGEAFLCHSSASGALLLPLRRLTLTTSLWLEALGRHPPCLKFDSMDNIFG